MTTEDDRNRKPAGDAESAAWSTASGEPVPETQPADETGSDAKNRQASQRVGPETDHRGTDQESIRPGRSKPASEPAEDAPPHGTPGEPQ